jgi:hypothetical protein
VTVIAREIDVDYISIRTPVGPGHVREICESDQTSTGARQTRGHL